MGQSPTLLLRYLYKTIIISSLMLCAGKMGDIYTSLAILAFWAFSIFTATLWFGAQMKPIQLNALAIATTMLAGVYAMTLWQQVAMASLLPFSGLIVLSNWFPLLAAVVSGLAWHRIPGGTLRKAVPCVGLCATAWLAVLFPLLGEPPACDDLWTRDGFCLQTTKQTCTAACAASLLRQRGIDANEQEMAELCLTRSGTTWQGLYRGLKLKTSGTAWDVRVVHGDVEQLLAQTDSPMIVSVGLEKHADVDGSYEREDGWQPGMRHSVVLLGKQAHGRIGIVDPNPEIRREQWSCDELELLYRGPAIQLVARR